MRKQQHTPARSGTPSLDSIRLEGALPLVFAPGDGLCSDVWLRRTTIERAGITLIHAPSGTGKSSLLSFLIGQRHDYLGQILFGADDIRSLPPRAWTALRRNSISMLFQDLRLFPELSAWDNVRVKNQLTRHQPEPRLRQWFDELGIAAKADTPARLLSYGQQQRVAFVRALAQPFGFILLDEPVSHLDDQNASIMASILLDEAKRNGAGIVVTSIGKHLPLPYTSTLRL